MWEERKQTSCTANTVCVLLWVFPQEQHTLWTSNSVFSKMQKQKSWAWSQLWIWKPLKFGEDWIGIWTLWLRPLPKIQQLTSLCPQRLLFSDDCGSSACRGRLLQNKTAPESCEMRKSRWSRSFFLMCYSAVCFFIRAWRSFKWMTQCYYVIISYLLNKTTIIITASFGDVY